MVLYAKGQRNPEATHAKKGNIAGTLSSSDTDLQYITDSISYMCPYTVSQPESFIRELSRNTLPWGAIDLGRQHLTGSFIITTHTHTHLCASSIFFNPVSHKQTTYLQSSIIAVEHVHVLTIACPPPRWRFWSSWPWPSSPASCSWWFIKPSPTTTPAQMDSFIR